MKKRNIILAIVACISIITYIRLDRIKLYFANERYYSILSALHITKPHYKPDKNFDDIFIQEGFDYKKSNTDIIDSSLKKLSTQQYKAEPVIPRITHHVYFTTKEKPIVLNPFYLENLQATFRKLNMLGGEWQHNIWTNYPGLFPDEIKNINNVKIRNIDEFKDNVLYNSLIDNLDKGVKERGYYCAASDMTRYLVLQKFGGIYKDMDYEIYNPEALFDLMKKFDYIGGREKISIKSYYGNSFIAAKPNHPVLNETLRLLYRNYHLDDKSPLYLHYPGITLDRIYFSSPPLITIAYFSKNNVDGNSDIILPAWMVYNTNFAHYKNNGCDYNKLTKQEVIDKNNNLTVLMQNFLSSYTSQIPLDGKLTDNEQNIYYNTKYRDAYPIIGADMFCGTWVPGNNFQKIYYWNIPFLGNK